MTKNQDFIILGLATYKKYKNNIKAIISIKLSNENKKYPISRPEFFFNVDKPIVE